MTKSRWLSSICVYHLQFPEGPLDLSSVLTVFIYVSICWSGHTGMFMCKCTYENVAYVFIFTSQVVSRMTCLGLGKF